MTTMKNKALFLMANSNYIFKCSSWNTLNINIRDCISKLKRHWRYKHFSYLMNQIEYSEEFKDYDFYEDLSIKYGLKNIIFKYTLRKRTQQLKHIPLDFISVCNNRTYNGKTIAELCKTRIGFDIMLADDSHPKLKIDKSDENDVHKFLEMLHTWREYTGNYEPLDRMVYRGGGYEPY